MSEPQQDWSLGLDWTADLPEMDLSGLADWTALPPELETNREKRSAEEAQ